MDLLLEFVTSSRGLSTIGLGLDIVAVVILTTDLIVSDEEAAKRSETRWGGNSDAARGLRISSKKAQWAMALLAIGFGLQIVALYV